MNPESIERKIEAADASWQEVVQGHPQNFQCGFFVYSDGPPASGGGIGVFAWFPDRDAMLDFISSTLPYSPPGPCHFNPADIAISTAEIVELMRRGELTDSQGIVELNKALFACSQFEWIGTVDQLLVGNHSYAIKVRNRFRDNDDDDLDCPPIRENEKSEFFEFLNTWGC